MTIIGFHYTKMLAERYKRNLGKVNVNTNLSFEDVREAKVNMGASNQKGVEFSFIHKSEFEPEAGYIEMKGAVVYLGDEKEAKKILDQWKNKETVPAKVTEDVYNFLLAKVNVQALILEKDMGLPAHIKMPTVEVKAKK